MSDLSIFMYGFFIGALFVVLLISVAEALGSK